MTTGKRAASFPALHTPRLRLRELTLRDAPALFAIHGDPQVAQWFGSDPLPDAAAAEKLIATFASWRVLPNPGTRWGIERTHDGALIGTCGLFGWNRRWSSCTLGYELARAAWGQGYMSEALACVLPWGFEAMALNRVEAKIHADNTASVRLARRFGFVREGVLREVAHWGGAYHDLVQFSLLRRDFERLQRKNRNA